MSGADPVEVPDEEQLIERAEPTDEPGPPPDDGPPADVDLLLDTDFAPWDGRRVPVTLLGGYLGAGKTTIINEVLARTDRPIAVLVNDVGAVNIDASLIKRRHGDTIELTDGCVCCSISQGLVEAFDGLRKRRVPPDQVILELSGVAQPARVVPFANSDGFRLDGVVVLVDVDQFLDRIDEPVAGAAILGQIAGADVLVLTKTDLVDEQKRAAVLARLAEVRDGKPVFDSAGPLAAAGFLNVGTRSPEGYAAVPEPSLFDGHVTSITPLSTSLTLPELEHLVDALDESVLRAKAIARTADGGHHLVQVVGKRRSVSPLPAAEAQPATDLVVITARH